MRFAVFHSESIERHLDFASWLEADIDEITTSKTDDDSDFDYSSHLPTKYYRQRPLRPVGGWFAFRRLGAVYSFPGGWLASDAARWNNMYYYGRVYRDEDMRAIAGLVPVGRRQDDGSTG